MSLLVSVRFRIVRNRKNLVVGLEVTVVEEEAIETKTELFDSAAPHITENRTVANSLLLFLKYFAKYLYLNRLYQTIENLK